MEFIGATLSLIIGGVFLASAIPKLRHPRGFILSVLEYRVLPPFLGKLYGHVIPSLELFIALLLFVGSAVRSATAIAALLLLSFIIATGINMIRGRDLDCHCFGTTRQRSIGWGLLLQDMFLLGAVIALGIIAQAWVALEPWSIFRLLGLAEITNFSLLLGLCAGIGIGTTILLRNWDRAIAAWGRTAHHPARADEAASGPTQR